MAPRLGHNKSRRGCVRCKTRKVKCDETRPQCLACSRHHLACEYDEFQHLTGQKAKTQRAVRSKKAPPRQSSVTNSGTEESETPFGILSDFYGDLEKAFDPDSRRVLELRLLHYFSVVVAPTFPATESNDASSIWICEAIFLALDHSFLLNAIFAIAAQHAALGIAEGVQPASVTRSSLSEKTRANFNRQTHRYLTRQRFNHVGAYSPTSTDPLQNHARVHRVYLNAAIQGQRHALETLGDSSADAVFLTTILLSTITLQPIRESLSPVDETIQPYTLPLQWLAFANALGTLLVGPCLASSDSLIMSLLRTTDPPLSDKNFVLNAANLTPTHTKILSFRANSTTTLPILGDLPSVTDSELSDAETMAVYVMALTYAAGVQAAIRSRQTALHVVRRLMSFPTQIPPKFIKIVGERRPRALVILTHVMVCAKYVEKYWWCKGVAEREVGGLKALLGEEQEEWEWAFGEVEELMDVGRAEEPKERQR